MNEKTKEDCLSASNNQQAIIYCRTASWPQTGASEALAEQEERCRAYAKERQYIVIDVVRDIRVSGTILERVGIKAMLNRLKTEDGLTVLVDQPARLGRGAKTTQELEDLLARHGALIDFPTKRSLPKAASRLIKRRTSTGSRRHTRGRS